METTRTLIMASLILALPGIYLLWFGIWLLKGGGKAFYMARHIYAGRVYAIIPGGITFLCWFLAGILKSEILVYLGIGFGLLALIFNFTQPSFLKPAWFKWLEREHSDIMPILSTEVRILGDKIWNDRMQTQQDLEDWVAEVRRKHRL